MPLYFVDVADGVSATVDRSGTEVASLEAACTQTTDLLMNMAKERAADAPEQVLVATIRDAAGTAVRRVTLALMSVTP